MTKTQQWVIGAALAIVLVMAAGWFLLVSPQRSKAADLRTQTTAEQTASAALRTDLDVLVAQAKTLPAKRAELAKFAKQMPSDPALPAMIRALQNAAVTAGVTLVSIAPQPPAPFVGVAPAAPAAAAPAPAVANPALPQGVTAPGTLQSITLTTKMKGSYSQLAQFVANLEALPRMFMVTAYSIGPSATGTGGATVTRCTQKACLIDLEVTGQVFIAPALVAPPVPVTAK